MKLHNFKGWLKAQNKLIVDETDEEVLLRGIALGNLFNLEGYLLGTSQFGNDMGDFVRANPMDRGRTLHTAVKDLAGPEYTKKFQHQWLHNYIVESDIQRIKDIGFNSIRIPLSARLFLKEEEGYHYVEENFQLLDRIIDWCEKSNLYAILDLHAAPGGQSGVSCDDGTANIPYMFLNSDYEERTLRLWEKIAERYKEKPIVAGYEVLNEPICLPKWDYLIPKLKSFYDKAVERIRKIDQRHILFLQGNRFATRFEIFDHDYDPQYHNWVITTHLYERLPDLQVFGPMLAKSDELNVPIWLGETGGNTHDGSKAGEHWMSMTYEYALENHIGFCIWTYKSTGGAAWLYKYNNPIGFNKLTDYFYKGAPKPTYQESQNVLNELLENIKTKNSEFNKARAAAILQKSGSEVLAIGYDPQHNHYGKWPYAIASGFRREDHMHFIHEDNYREPDIGSLNNLRQDKEKYGELEHLLLRLSAGEKVSYTFRNIDQACDLILDYQKAENAHLEVKLGHDTKVIVLNGDGQKNILKLNASPELTITLILTSGSIDLKSLHVQI